MLRRSKAAPASTTTSTGMESAAAPAGPPIEYSLPVIDDSVREASERIVEHLRERGINFLGIDFDLTMIDLHTGGRWPGTAKELSSPMRPLFFALVPLAITRGIYVAIVTFSPQVSMIAEVLKEAFPENYTKIPIRGEDRSWEYHGEGAVAGKQTHLASAAEELSQINADLITRGSTLLIDDDSNNVMTALNNGVKAVFVDPRHLDTLVSDLLAV